MLYINDIFEIESNMLCAYSVIAFDAALVFVVRFKNGEDVSGNCSVSASYLALCIVGRLGMDG